MGVLLKKNGEVEQYLRCLSPLACLIVAPPGTGKTASIALPNLFSISNSVVVLDIKGELYQKSAGFRQQKFGHKILRFSPLSTEENTMFFNPFDRKVIQNLDYVEQKTLADQIAGTIFVGEKGKENSDPNKFVYFIGDEFVRFGKMPYLLEDPALCRSYGLIPIYITQSYEQIKKYYGEDDLNILRSNVGYQVVFTMNSAKDAEELSKMIGKFTRKKLSTSKGNLDLIKSNDSVSSEGYELVPAQDILNMPNTDILILIRGFVKHPIKAKVNFWFKNKEWNGADKIPVKSEEELQQEKILIAQEQESLESTQKEAEAQAQAEDLKPQTTPRPRIQAVIDTREKIARINALKKAKEDLQKTQESLEKQGLEETQELDKEEAQEESQENTQNPKLQESQESQEIPQDSKEQEEINRQEVKEKEAFIEQELGKEGLKEFFMTLVNKCGNCETEEEYKSLLKTFQNRFYNNEMSLEKIKQIIEAIKEEQEEDTA